MGKETIVVSALGRESMPFIFEFPASSAVARLYLLDSADLLSRDKLHLERVSCCS